VTRFSTPRITPPPVAMPMAVDPSLMASREYSTWKRRPSGEKVLLDASFRCLLLFGVMGGRDLLYTPIFAGDIMLAI